MKCVKTGSSRPKYSCHHGIILSEQSRYYDPIRQLLTHINYSFSENKMKINKLNKKKMLLKQNKQKTIYKNRKLWIPLHPVFN